MEQCIHGCWVHNSCACAVSKLPVNVIDREWAPGRGCGSYATRKIWRPRTHLRERAALALLGKVSSLLFIAIHIVIELSRSFTQKLLNAIWKGRSSTPNMLICLERFVPRKSWQISILPALSLQATWRVWTQPPPAGIRTRSFCES